MQILQLGLVFASPRKTALLKMFMCMWMWVVVVVAVAQQPPPPPLLVNAPPSLAEVPPMAVTATRSTHRSIETLVVVLAVIVIVGVIAGVFARVCGGRRLAGNGDHDIEGWVERKCASCIDSGVPPPPPPQESKAAEGEAKK